MRWRLVMFLGCAVAATGCGSSRETLVTPWLKVTTNRETVWLPHALGFGENSEVAAVRVGGRWETVAKGYTSLPVWRVGDAVVVGPDRLVFREGDAEPKTLPPGVCPEAWLRPDAPSFICFGCGDGPSLRPLPERRRERCDTITVADVTLGGERRWSRTAVLTTPGPACEPVFFDGSLSAAGVPVFRVDCLVDGRWVSHRFVMGDDGFDEVPDGTPLVAPRQPEQR